MTSKEIREKFLDFFKERGHAIVPSSSLIPENDTTTLFVGSGMQPLLRYLLGEAHPEGKRLVNVQKSFRTEDIDEVGDNRHTTFFEMLGNWSLGDYFKEEQLSWVFEFFTQEVGLDPSRLYVTVFSGDEKNNIPPDKDSVEIWKRLFREKGVEARDVEFVTEERARQVGMQEGRIFCYREKNWWSRAGSPEKMPPNEPGGPDSEVFYDFGTPHDSKFGTHCHPNCDCGRFIEIGNSVFMEYKKSENGTFEKLPQRNVDFGGGLERITMASQHATSVFETDLFTPIIELLPREANLRDARIAADHARASAFLIADGVRPSNKGAGYVLRRILRRLVTVADIPPAALVRKVAELYAPIYPELKSDVIVPIVEAEQKKFTQTLVVGLRELERLTSIDVAQAFKLYESYGLPFEVIKDYGGERTKDLSREDFDKEFAKHQEISRAGSEAKFGGHGLYLKTGEVTIRDESEVEKVTRLHTATHLLHAALRATLGPEVQQNGSDITVERTRFDFNFPRKVTPEELKKVEGWVNDAVKKDLKVEWKETTYNEAIAEGALGFFKAKYPERVKVYTMSDPATGEVYSKELCGGPHVEHTATIGKFTITKEESSSAGVRRIRGVVD